MGANAVRYRYSEIFSPKLAGLVSHESMPAPHAEPVHRLYGLSCNNIVADAERMKTNLLSVGLGGWRYQARREFDCRIVEGVWGPDCRHRCRQNCRQLDAKQRHCHRFLIPGDSVLTIGCVKGGEAIT